MLFDIPFEASLQELVLFHDQRAMTLKRSPINSRDGYDLCMGPPLPGLERVSVRTDYTLKADKLFRITITFMSNLDMSFVRTLAKRLSVHFTNEADSFNMVCYVNDKPIIVEVSFNPNGYIDNLMFTHITIADEIALKYRCPDSMDWNSILPGFIPTNSEKKDV
ncbi:MAG: hypothetical protein GY804_08815 [Alphaproteobacteria bacterium]|nr:hypothetical protein [Alphaproteobacteria bacterium]